MKSAFPGPQVDSNFPSPALSWNGFASPKPLRTCTSQRRIQAVLLENKKCRLCVLCQAFKTKNGDRELQRTVIVIASTNPPLSGVVREALSPERPAKQPMRSNTNKAKVTCTTRLGPRTQKEAGKGQANIKPPKRRLRDGLHCWQHIGQHTRTRQHKKALEAKRCFRQCPWKINKQSSSKAWTPTHGVQPWIPDALLTHLRATWSGIADSPAPLNGQGVLQPKTPMIAPWHACTIKICACQGHILSSPPLGKLSLSMLSVAWKHGPLGIAASQQSLRLTK